MQKQGQGEIVSLSLSVGLSVCLPVCLFACLFVCLSVGRDHRAKGKDERQGQGQMGRVCLAVSLFGLSVYRSFMVLAFCSL